MQHITDIAVMHWVRFLPDAGIWAGIPRPRVSAFLLALMTRALVGVATAEEGACGEESPAGVPALWAVRNKVNKKVTFWH